MLPLSLAWLGLCKDHNTSFVLDQWLCGVYSEARGEDKLSSLKPELSCAGVQTLWREPLATRSGQTLDYITEILGESWLVKSQSILVLAEKGCRRSSRLSLQLSNLQYSADSLPSSALQPGAAIRGE